MNVVVEEKCSGTFVVFVVDFVELLRVLNKVFSDGAAGTFFFLRFGDDIVIGAVALITGISG